MAQKITVALEDDLDGGPADETVRFAIGGAEYEIDLSKKNARALRRRLAPFVDHARKAGRDRAAGPGALRQAASAAAISGPGRKTTGSRSATGGASPHASLISTKPDTEGTWHKLVPGRPKPAPPRWSITLSTSCGLRLVPPQPAADESPTRICR